MTRAAVEDLDWRARGNCARQDPDVMFPEPDDPAGIRAAKRICGGCPVLTDCRAWVGVVDPEFGVFAGTSEIDRREAKARARRAHKAELRRALRARARADERARSEAATPSVCARTVRAPQVPNAYGDQLELPIKAAS